MKKVFSLLLVVAMLVSLSLVASAAPANAAGGMHTVITDNGATATIDVYIANGESVNGFTSYIVTDAVTYKDGAKACGPFAGCDLFTPTTNKAGYIKFVVGWLSNDNAMDIDGLTKVLTYNVNKVDANKKLTEADFAYSTSTIKVSKVTTVNGGLVAGVAGGNNFTTAKAGAYFTLAVDAGSDFDATAAGTTITCTGKVDATVENYGVVFTAESTVEGARAQKYYGAMPGDTVKDYNGSTTFTFGDWDGTFEIVLVNVHAGEKELNFFANDTVIADTNFTLTIAE